MDKRRRRETITKRFAFQTNPKVFIAFDDMIGDIQSNKKVIPIVTELFIRGRKLNIF